MKRSRRRIAEPESGVSAASTAGAVLGAAPAVWLVLAAVAGLVAADHLMGPRQTFWAAHWTGFWLFTAVAAWRPCLVVASRLSAREGELRPPAVWPRYTVIAPLRDEAAMAGQIVERLRRLDYPVERLEILLALEADDGATRRALLATGLPPWMRVVVAPPAAPGTKPRACNVALARSSGELVVIYDAEDEPDPGQLREAAASFACGPTHRGCLQAPLRVHERPDALRRQFALEYAALFEVALPALRVLRCPFPLGGTSNHFRRVALDDVGGWDAFNVTEDADIGLRLTARGWTLGMLSSPTWEEAPASLAAWTPQRTRWLKGYVQTWAGAMRTPLAGGFRHFLALQSTLGLAVASSLLHGPMMLLMAALLLLGLLDFRLPPVLWLDAGLMALGWASAVFTMAAGARRAGLRMTVRDALLAPGYWCLQSMAAAYALHQLAFAPHRWDKTPHLPTIVDPIAVALDGAPERRIAKAA